MSDTVSSGSDRITFDVSEWEAHLVLGALGMQAEDPEPLPDEDVSELHNLRDDLVGQFREQSRYHDTGGEL